MTMGGREGRVFSEAEPEEVIDFLLSRKLESHPVPPEMLQIVNVGNELLVRIVNGKVREYPVRRSFLLKLFKWYHFPEGQLRHFSLDTVVSVLNDFLLAIRGEFVTVRVEDGEAVSMTSDRYNEVADLDIVSLVRQFGMTKISRDDFCTRIYTATPVNIAPVPGEDRKSVV